MPRKKLTEKEIAKLKAPRGSQVLYWDNALPGFGVLVSGTTGTRTYVAKGMVTGRGVRRKIGRAGVMTLVEARAQAKRVMAGFSSGIDPRQRKASAATLGEVLDGYLKRAGLKPRSREFYSDAIERHFHDWLDKPIGTIDSEMVEGRHKLIAKEVEARDRARNAQMAKRHLQRAERTERDWPDASARHRSLWEAARERQPRSGHGAADGAMRCLRALMNFAADKDPEFGPNPVRLTKLWFKPPRRKRLVKADDLAGFYAAVTRLENKIARDYLRFLLFTGLRRREAAELRWSHVDLKGGVIRIPAPITKPDRAFDLPVTDVVRDILIGLRGMSPTFLFPASSASGHIEEPKSALAEVRDICGIGVSVHDLRRTFASVAEGSAISFIELKTLLNHAVGKDVTAGYVVVPPEQLRSAAQRVADRMKELCDLAEPGGNVVGLKGKK